jgi:hypothetical protein
MKLPHFQRLYLGNIWYVNIKPTYFDVSRKDLMKQSHYENLLAKNVICTQKLHAHHHKQQLQKTLPMQVQYVVHLLTLKLDLTLCQMGNGIITEICSMLWLVPQLLANKPDVLHHAETLPHIHTDVTTFLTNNCPSAGLVEASPLSGLPDHQI